VLLPKTLFTKFSRPRLAVFSSQTH
jgi:hypothetical protein